MVIGLPAGELLAVKEVAMNVEGAHQKEAVEQLEHEVSSWEERHPCHKTTECVRSMQ